MESQSTNLTVSEAHEGRSLSVVGDTYRVVVGGEQTGEAYAVIDMLIPPQGGPGPHSHKDIREAFYVLDGEIEVKTETQTIVARKGAFVEIPPGGLVHCFKNKTDETAHMLCIVHPAGMDRFFEEIGTPVEAGAYLPPPTLGPDDLKRLQGIAEKYGQKLYPPDYLDK